MNLADPADKRFFIFTRLWCFSTLFHLVSFSYWFQYHPFFIGLVGTSCVLHLLKPIRNTFFYTGICGSILLILSQIPHTPNHIFFEWFLNLIFAGVIILWLIKKQKLTSLGNYFFANTLTVTRWSLVILYFFVVLHKLNFDFFDPYASCGAVLFEEIFQRSGVFRIGAIRDFYYAHEITFKVSSIYFSLVAEAIIPILLMVKRWRNVGIVFAIIFHFLLSLHGHNGIFSFSAMLFTLFTFFWSDGVINYFYSIWEKKHNWIAYAAICGLGILISVNLSLPYFYYVLASLLAWFVYAVLYSFIFFKAVYRHYANTEFTYLGNPRIWVVWAIPVLIFVNGSCPYLGLKTETSFSMFSNLRTEGNKTNHFFIPTSWQIFDYQKELVLIKKSNYSRLQNLDLYHGQVDVKMVKWEFIKILNYAPENSFVDYEINGKPGYFEKVNGKITASELDLYMSPVLNKIFDFRLVHPDKSLCKH